MGDGRITRLVGVAFAFVVAWAIPAHAQRNLDVKRAEAPMAAEQRVALVIGNAAYKSGPLKNPVNDARAIADRLQRLGFTVVKRENLKAREIGPTLREFRSKLSAGATALFFYAGHGMQVRGANYFPAVDADIEAEEDVPTQSMNLSQVLELMDDMKAKVNLVFLDACRDNPFARKFRSGSRGLARVDTTASGILISFATRPGSVAADGDGRNGLYTEHLLKRMEEPGVPVEQMLKRVGIDVKLASKGRQEPWSEGLIEGDFFFRPGSGAAVASQPAPAAPVAVPTSMAATQVASIARPVGSVSIYSRTPGVEISIDDNRAGMTNAGMDLLISNVEEGTHRVVAKKGRRTWEQTIQVAANSRQQVDVHLDALSPGFRGELLAQILKQVDDAYYVPPDYAKFFAGALRGLQKAAPQGALTVAQTGGGVSLSWAVPGKGATRVEFETPSRGELADEMQAAARLVRDAFPAIDPVKLEKSVLSEALGGLDIYSSYLDPEEFKELQVGVSGSFGGVGMEVGTADGYLQVVAPLEGTPAYRAGLQPKDIIVSINGATTKDVSLAENVKRLRGTPGSEVRVQVRREGAAALLDFTLRREIIRVQSVKSRTLEPGIAYISIRQIQQNTAEMFGQALEQASSSGMRALVLDLRNCPGGLLQTSADVVGHLEDSGRPVVTTSGRSPGSTASFSAARSRSFTGFPVAVLVHEGTASGCEIIAGALQDFKRAVVVGNRTFGKGSVQTIAPLTAGGAVKLTTAEYRTPSGRRINEAGVEPDVLNPAPLAEMQDPAKDTQLQRAVAQVKSMLPKARP